MNCVIPTQIKALYLYKFTEQFSPSITEFPDNLMHLFFVLFFQKQFGILGINFK